MVEVAVEFSVVGVAELLTRPPGDASPEDRLLELIAAFNNQVAANETVYRSAQRHYQDA